MMNAAKALRRARTVPWEAILWFGALAALASSSPGVSHFTVCPLANLGIRYCPGCGLGRSIAYLLHGQFRHSFEAHPLGIFALVVLVHRIVSLARTRIKYYGQNN